jgi:hypothetical protein
MTLLFKEGEKDNPANYRPITLLNTAYKIFSLVVNKRLLKYSDDIIGKAQKGFINGKMTLDNILNLKIALHHNAKVVLLDFSKAFDSVSHLLILDSLKSLGFANNFISLINSMLGGFTSIRYCPDDRDFFCFRGVRQGDPISPILFAIAIEPLLRLLNPVEDIFSSPSNAKAALAYADDIAILAQTWSDIDDMCAVVVDFSAISGLQLNVKKCQIYAPTAVSFSSDEFSVIHKFRTDPEVKYLGIYINQNNGTSISNTVWNNVLQRLPKWKEYFTASSTSAQGRSRLINSYVTSVLNYQLFFDTPSDSQAIEYDRIVSKLISRNTLGHREELWRPNAKHGGLSYFPLKELSIIYKAWWFNRWKLLSNSLQAPEWVSYINTNGHQCSFFKPFADSFSEIKDKISTDTFSTIDTWRGIQKYIKHTKTALANFFPNGSLYMENNKLLPKEIFPRVSRLKINSRIKNFLWELYMSKLPVNQYDTCPLCCSNKDSLSGNHLQRCLWLKAVIVNTTNSYINSVSPYTIPIADVTDALSLTRSKYNVNELCILIIWTTWKVLNSISRDDKDKDQLYLGTFNRQVHIFNYKLAHTTGTHTSSIRLPLLKSFSTYATNSKRKKFIVKSKYNF